MPWLYGPPANELAAGPVWLGVEIANAGPGKSADFSAEGDAAMQIERESIEAQLPDEDSFYGIIFQDSVCSDPAATRDGQQTPGLNPWRAVE